MATVTGRIVQQTGSPLTGLEPRVQILIPENTIYSNAVVVTKPAPITPDSGGNFAVNLVPSAQGRPLIDYSMVVTWLDSAGNFVSQDNPNFIFHVPEAGGSIDKLIVSKGTPFWWWKSTQPPAVRDDGTMWIDPVTGVVLRSRKAFS